VVEEKCYENLRERPTYWEPNSNRLNISLKKRENQGATGLFFTMKSYQVRYLGMHSFFN
jgi:hypothetical protein